LVYTGEVAALCTALTLLIALPAAYTIAFRLSNRMRDLAVTFLVVPVFSSYMLRIYAWQIVLSADGIVNSLIRQVGFSGLPLLGGQFSLQVGLLTLTLPVAILILVLAFAGVDRTLVEAAENLGCRRSKVIMHVLLPSIRNAVFLAGSTAFLMSFGDYISPLFMTGSKPPTLSILIVDTVKSGSQWPRASVIGVTMLAILALVFLVAGFLGRDRTRLKGGH
jgi:spermidine/putrescine transport system permease protein/putrescine transport system permease protein